MVYLKTPERIFLVLISIMPGRAISTAAVDETINAVSVLRSGLALITW